MTTYFREMRTCALCGQSSEHFVLGSTNAFGSPDLDLRPAEMQRSTMEQWIEECPHCGYAHKTIEEKVAGIDTPPQLFANVDETPASQLWRRLSDEYRSVSDRTSEPERNLVRRFLTASKVAEIAGSADDAAHYALCAAWAADDYNDQATALICRDLAADFFRAIGLGTDRPSDIQTVNATRLTDVLRRAKHWEEAIALSDQMLAGELDETIRAVLTFEREASLKQDAACYTIADALEGRPAPKAGNT